MDDFEGSYVPQSPDLSGLNDFDDTQPTFSTSFYNPPQPQYQHPHPFQPQTSIPTHNPYSFNQPPPQPFHQYSVAPRPSNGRPRAVMDDAEFIPEPTSAKSAAAARKPKKPKAVEEVMDEEVCEKPAPGAEEGIEVKTKFPVARIKRIMQADEDVGKVAQVTPTAVSKALELFMISVVTKAADTARAKSSRRVTAQHLKQAVQDDEQFDFLADIIAKVPDAPTAKKKDDTDESDDAAAEANKKKKKGAARRKKKDDDDE